MDISIDKIIKVARKRGLHSYECCKRFPCVPALRNSSEWYRCTFICTGFTPNMPMIMREQSQTSIKFE